MKQLTAADVRASFVNTSLRERKAVTLPTKFDALVWTDLDYLGWRDPKLPNIGYVVTNLADAPTGVMLRQNDGRTRSRPQCSWCEDVTLPNDVHYFTARRAGPAGRAGNTVSTLVCANFECSANVRKLPPMAYTGFDREAARAKRIATLELRSGRFVADLNHTA
ncbi:FBP domain-containing protein [Cryobacterium luteum]|uniref:FBP domain-containing protein n=1 Tax=Cryobacterium luteum TaxID=1424661 RepID=A0A1H8KIN1_9MICO|nr:FBP domain-containing protein [Cryobacterium luteum]TFB89993.1 FBP domain-containing protein [Cryobacterium luteum]SEN92725.1 FBP C-terminal treble-clef zinc-finger [Cryobacterium luteum]